ncbi:hypothetical protein [Streptomyces sp. NPDC048606]|uniref:hypothetical protein n=1 Tax=Streptomyces sp. NPDC048606 TaxID=3154726 RepID=UPI003424FAA2
MNERLPGEVVLVRAGPEGAAAESTVMRLVALLPARWTFSQRVTDDRITMLIDTSADTPAAARTEAVRDWLARTLADGSLRGWRAEDP